MAYTNEEKKKIKAEKDGNRRKYRILRELRFWLAGLLALCAVLTVHAFAAGRKEENSAADLASGEKYRNAAALSCGGTKISLMSLSFGFYDKYYGILESDSFIRDYRAFGLDETKPLRSSEYTVLRSWFDALMDEALESAENTARYAEKARLKGLHLSAADEVEIRREVRKLEERAQNEGRELDDYLDYRYGPGMTKEDVRAALAIYKLAQNQYNSDLKQLKSCGDAEIESYYNSHKKELDTADCVKYVFSAENEAAAREKAKRFTACESSGQFLDRIKEDLSDAGRSEQQIRGELRNCQVRLQYGDEGDLADWAFGAGAVKGETKAWFDGASCLVGYMVRPGGKCTFPSANVRGLFINSKFFPDPKKAKAKAEELYGKALENGTEQYFIKLVKENSQDESNASYGGEIADIVPGDLSEEYNDWVFAEGRKPGDIGLVESGGSYHIFYYLKDGDPCWEVSARNAMTDERVTAHQEKMKGEMPVEVDRELCDSLPDDLAVDHERAYRIRTSGGKVLRETSKKLRLPFYVMLGVSTVVLAVTVWCFAEVCLLKRHGRRKK